MKTSLLLAGLIASSAIASAADQATTNPNQTVSAAVNAVVDAVKHGQPKKQGFELSVFILDVERGTVSLVVDKVSDRLAYCGSPSWAPDGRRIVFDATPKGRVCPDSNSSD